MRPWGAPTGGDTNLPRYRVVRLEEPPVGAGRARECRELKDLDAL